MRKAILAECRRRFEVTVWNVSAECVGWLLALKVSAATFGFYTFSSQRQIIIIDSLLPFFPLCFLHSGPQGDFVSPFFPQTDELSRRLTGRRGKVFPDESIGVHSSHH